MDWGTDLMDKVKLKWRIFAFLIAFSAILVGILWLFQTVLLTDMYKFVRRGEMEKAITLVSKHIESDQLRDILEKLEQSKEIRVVPTQDFVPSERENADNHRLMPQAMTKTKQFTLSDGSTLSLTFHALITPVDATVSTLQMQLFFVTGIMILLSVGLALLIARRVSKPIEDINNSTKVLASGMYDTKFTGHGFLEVAELSDTLNTAAAELSKVENLRRELMANISHDLRTPLSLIYSYAEMMHDFPDEVNQEQTQTIMDETKRLTTLVNDVLDISKLETGTAQLNWQRYCLTDSIKNTVNRVSELVRKDGYDISFADDGSAFVTADEVKITQAFYNLLLNAITHGGEDKKVLVCQTRFKTHTRIEVIDHGAGIDAEDLPHIWDRYYKIDKVHKRAITGTGLGLSIVKKVMDLHGGAYGVESNVGNGSRFWIEL